MECREEEPNYRVNKYCIGLQWELSTWGLREKVQGREGKLLWRAGKNLPAVIHLNQDSINSPIRPRVLREGAFQSEGKVRSREKLDAEEDFEQ